MKKLKVLVLLGVVALSLAACKKEEPANEPETKQEAVKETKEEPKQDEPVSEEENPGFVRCGDRKTTGSRYGE